MASSEIHQNYNSRRGPEGTSVACGILVLALASFLGIGSVLLLAAAGVPVQTLEKGMVWLSVPWIASWYLKCRKWHRTRLVLKDELDVQTLR